MRDKYLWFTDLHLKPWTRIRLLNTILDEKPKGVFITGDISASNPTFLSDIEFLGKYSGRPIYFVYGNHDVWFSSFAKIKENIIKLSSKYKNLIWMSNEEFVSINDEVALIGEEGWYSGNIGNKNYIKYTLDWLFVKELRQLKTWEERFEYFIYLSKESSKIISRKLEVALENHKTIYLLTHFPPWVEAGRYSGGFTEEFWKPYNTNYFLGEELEKVMISYKKRKLIVLTGHSHSPMQIHASRNIECIVGPPGLHKNILYM